MPYVLFIASISLKHVISKICPLGKYRSYGKVSRVYLGDPVNIFIHRTPIEYTMHRRSLVTWFESVCTARDPHVRVSSVAMSRRHQYRISRLSQTELEMFSRESRKCLEKSWIRSAFPSSHAQITKILASYIWRLSCSL